MSRRVAMPKALAERIWAWNRKLPKVQKEFMPQALMVVLWAPRLDDQ